MMGRVGFKISFLLAGAVLASARISAWAVWEPGDLSIPHPDAPVIERVVIPAGEFLMGTAEGGDEDESPRHRVYLDEFEISKYEVTWAQFEAFIRAGGYENKEYSDYWSRKGAFSANQPIWVIDGVPGQRLNAPAWTPEGEGPTGFAERGHWPPLPNDPVVGISYWEAEAFCRFVGGRLPTEAEWEKAAAWGPDATSPRKYPWGDDDSLPLPANGFEVSEGFSRIASVDEDRYAGDVSAYGVRGLAGNVSEWVADMYDPDFYSQAPDPELPWENPFNLIAKRLDFVEEPGVPLPAQWVVRGGHYRINTRETERFGCARREAVYSTGRDAIIGFRVVWDRTPARMNPKVVARTDRPGAAVRIPAGTYKVGHDMGVPSDSGNRTDESPQHEVCLDSFWIGKYEVTWYEYKKFIEMGGYGETGGPKPDWWSEEGWQWRNHPPGSGGLAELAVTAPDLLGGARPVVGYDWPLLWKGPWIDAGEFSSPPDDHPVTGISWYEAEAYCRFVGGRLPKEVEWEVAASWDPEAGKPTQYPWGNLYTFTHLAEVGNTDTDPKYPGTQTSPVGVYPEGKSPFGCYDMAGNAFEWVEDWYHPESYSQHSSECGGPVTTPDWMKIDSPSLPGYEPVPGFKVNRGGGFDPSFDGTYSQRSRTRGTDGAMDFRNFTFGFRVVWDRDPETIPQAQAVRPPYVSGTDHPVPDPVDDIPSPPPTTGGYEEVYPNVNPIFTGGTLDVPGKEDWYRISGPVGALVEIDLDANGGADDPEGFSPLDAVIEIWHEGFEIPVKTRDDEMVDTGDPNIREVYLDPPVLMHRIPKEGYFWVKVRAYSWPGEGSQAGLSMGERSYTGEDSIYTIQFRAPSVQSNEPEPLSWDLNNDGIVDAGDALEVLEGIRAKSSKRVKADLDGDGTLNHRDVFMLINLWNQYGKTM